MRTVAIIQGRMTSARLPGKILQDLAGKPLFFRIVERARASDICDDVVVATSSDPSDDTVAEACAKEGVPCFRGDLNDVLKRYFQAAQVFQADIIVRLTADCPLLDPDVIATVVRSFDPIQHDYVSNVLERTFPKGLDTEVFSIQALERMHREAHTKEDREHVTTYIRRNRASFKTASVRQDIDRSLLRWTVDLPSDLLFARRIFANMPHSVFGQREILDLLKRKPDLSNTYVIFRVDGSPEIGTGHVMRCLALAQAMKNAGIPCRCVSSALTPSLKKRIQECGLPMDMIDTVAGTGDDAAKTIDLLQAHAAEWLVIDGYIFGKEYSSVVRKAGAHVLCIDDVGQIDTHDADVILDQNIATSVEYYADATDAKLLLGPRYALLRSEFQHWQDWRRPEQKPKNILITMGGSDPDNVTSRVIKMLEKFPTPLILTVIVGGANRHHDAIASAAQSSPHAVHVLHDVQDMPQVLSQADIAICAGGTTTYEMMFMQLPMLTVILARNQEAVAHAVEQADCGLCLGKYETMQTEKLWNMLRTLLQDEKGHHVMAEYGRRAVDGYGADRVAMAVQRSPLRLRKAIKDDCRTLWEWANEPATRAASFSDDPIPWETHKEWFMKKISQSDVYLWIGVDEDDKPVGIVRFEPNDGGGFLVSIAIDRQKQGKGIGRSLLHIGIARMLSTYPHHVIHAFVKTTNGPSLALFDRAGFIRIGMETIRGHEAIHYILSV
jgi:UDP-2,4-diacetamido-2,4,6-trideoxy-beta-L-altropyranose hydrolase